MLSAAMARRRCRPFLLVAAVLVFAAGVGAARAEYPERSIRLIHGFGAGGPADSLSRIMADALSRELKQPVVVEAKPGAGGQIGGDAVARAEPDGYTLGLVTGGHAVSGALYNKLPFDAVESFQMISTTVDYAFVVAARPEFEAKDLPALVALAKARPGSLNFGSAGVGTTQHLAGELLMSMAGIRMQHVPYRGDAPAIVGLLNGQVQVMIAASAVAAPLVQAGKVKAIAVTTAERWSGLPETPTVAESGVAGYDVRTWAGILGPKGMPRPVVDRLNAAIVTVFREPEVKAKIEAIVAGTVRTRSPEDMRTMVASEVARWSKVIADANIPKQ